MENKLVQSQTYTITGDSLFECVRGIDELIQEGETYTIIKQQTIPKGGLLGFFQKKQIELTYVLNHFMGITPKITPKPYFVDDYSIEREKILKANNYKIEKDIDPILQELRELRKEVKSSVPFVPEEEHKTIAKIRENLENNDFSALFIEKIITDIKNNFSLQNLEDYDLVEKSVVAAIAQSVPIKSFADLKFPRVFILVGPTGVGKTTTVAKLTALYKFIREEQNEMVRDVRIISSDQYKLGAQLQLESYASIMDTPFELVQTNQRFQQLLYQWGKEADLVIIDTTGHSPKDYKSLTALKELLNVKNIEYEVFLTVSASTKYRDLNTILDKYEIFNYDSIIVTKLDETESVGSIISVVSEKNKAVGFVSIGQNVPQDFEQASENIFLHYVQDFKIDTEQYGFNIKE